jgi:hypothetical protein
MGNCSDCKSFINKTELALGLFSDTNESTSLSSFEKNYSVFLPILSKLIALYRGYTERKMFIHVYKQSKPEYSYFSKSEILETLSKTLTQASFKESRKEVLFKSGKYTGE